VRKWKIVGALHEPPGGGRPSDFHPWALVAPKGYPPVGYPGPRERQLPLPGGVILYRITPSGRGRNPSLDGLPPSRVL